ncbi:winged helix-turn-helix domain-containing protein [Streptomyces sp. NPDC048664]|uniref:winged helix-turn-helix domain-containing protein n=1 Tax=Streptomyces sp. NPDC048664 TaxID=3154505 RepID=UPI003440161E
MATTRSLPSAAPLSPAVRLRAVGQDETAAAPDFLPPGATWLPAPPHALPSLPGRPPMIGYLVLVPAGDQAVPTATVAPAPAPTALPTEVEGASPGGGERAVRVDTVQRTAQVDGRELDLTYLEFELLAHLVAHPGRVHSRDQLVATVWGYGHVGDGRTVDVHVARLRRKLGAGHRGTIQTVRRVGYKYVP